MESIAEVWLSVEGYEGIYEVSSRGRVKSLDRIVSYRDGRKNRLLVGIVLKMPLNDKGYPAVCLHRDGRAKVVCVYRLVATSFCERSPGTEVNHIDGDKTNSLPENLEWVTRRENILHAVRTGLHRTAYGEKNQKSKLKESQVAEIKRRHSGGDGNTVSLAAEYGVNHSTIGRILRGVSWKKVRATA